KILVPRDYDIGAAGQRSLQRLIGLPAHDHRLAPGDRAEMLQVGFESPWQPSVAPDHAVLAGGRDEEDRGRGRRRVRGAIGARAIAHTATSALMCGCGS